MGKLRSLVSQVVGKRVVPQVPAGHVVEALSTDRSGEASDSSPDLTSALSFFIHYEGGTIEGGRRVTLRRIDAQGATMSHFLAHCHERGKVRTFRVDHVLEAVDLATGEVLDCKQFHDFVMCRSAGLVERRLLTMTKMLVFMAKCDGRAVATEWDALDRSVVRLHRSLLDDDSGVDLLIDEARRLAPDGRDFVKGLYSLSKTRLPARTHSEFRRAIGAIVDADGYLHPEETAWAMEASDAIGRMPTCD